MDDPIILQYVGFETKGEVREYTFRLRGHGGESSNYFVTIANEAFSAHRARYQDAPEICSQRLRRELAGRSENPARNSFAVTDAELADYKDAHTPKPKPSYAKEKEQKNF